MADSWTKQSREMLEYNVANAGPLQGGEHMLAVLVEISEKLSEILEMQGSDVSPVGPGGTAPYPIGVKRDSLREAL